MADAEASGSFDVNVDEVEAALRSLEEHLAALETKFANAGPGISSHLHGIDAAAQQAAAGLHQTSQAGESMGIFGRVFSGAASGAMGLVHALGEVSHFAFLIPNSLGAVGTALGGVLGKIHPLGPAMVNAFSAALPGIKSGLNHFALFDRGIQAITGRLGPLGALMTYVSARATGMGRALSAATASGALGISAMVGSGRMLIGVMTSLAGTVVSSLGAIGTALHVALPEFLPIALAVAALASAFLAVKSAVGHASEMQDFHASMETLLGSTDAVTARMEELMQLEPKTPYTLSELVQANKTLEGFTEGALSSVEGMTLVGDAASHAQRPIADVALWVGRMYAAMKAGRATGDALSSLGEMNVILPKTRNEIEKLQAAGKNQEAWNVARAALEQYSGQMEKRSATWSGLFSSLSSQIGIAFTKMGAPIIDAISPMLKGIGNTVHTMWPLFEGLGTLIAGVFRSLQPVAVAFFNMMNYQIKFFAKALTDLNRLLGFKPLIPASSGEAKEKNTDPFSTRKASGGGAGSTDYGTSEMQQHGGGGSRGIAGLSGNTMLDEQRRTNDYAAQQLSVLQQIRDSASPRAPGGSGTDRAAQIPISI